MINNSQKSESRPDLIPENEIGSVNGYRSPFARLGYSKKLPVPKIAYCVDFFCGCGGMSYGFAITRQSHMRFQVVAGVDINAPALETYERNVGAQGIYCDIRELGQNPELLHGKIKHFDLHLLRPLVFVACPPCQGFSAMRKGDERDDDRNDLLSSFVALVRHFAPDAIVVENVPEMLKGRFSAYYLEAHRELSDLGYKLSESVVDCSEFGVPQKRRRALVVGSRDGQLVIPTPLLEAPSAQTVRDAISHLNPLGAGQIDKYDPWHRAPSHTDRLVEMFRLIPPDGGDRRALPSEKQIKAHQRLDNSKTPGFTDVYGRLRWDTPSVTITAKSRSPTSGRFLHPEQHRNISVREAAILQSFPQSYEFAGTPTQQYRQIGEAVPPMLSRAIAWQALDYFQGKGHQADVPRRMSLMTKKRCDSKIKFVDGFCGAGGLSLGFEASGFENVLAFDADDDAIKTYMSNISNTAVVADINDDKILRVTESATGAEPFCLIAGPPCQGFSHQRRGDSDDPRNNLVLSLASLIESLKRRPLGIVLENVTDLELPRGRKYLHAFLDSLQRWGYVAFRHELNSANFAVAQLRKRILVVALRADIAEHYKGPRSLTPKRWVTVGEAIGDLPVAASGEVANHEPSQEGELNRRRIAFVDMGRGRTMIPEDLQLPCHARSYRGHRDVYGRLDWFSQARTITGGFDSFTRGEFAHPFFHRSITPREAARLQGFPDDFVFYGNRASVRRQIGNAVPPPMAYAIAKAIKLAFNRALK